MLARSLLALSLATAVLAGCSGSEEAVVAADGRTVADLRVEPCLLVSEQEVADVLAEPILALAIVGETGELTQMCRYLVDGTGTAPSDPSAAPAEDTTTTTTPGQVPDVVPPEFEDDRPLELTIEFRTSARAGEPARILPSGEAVKGLGNEAAFDPQPAARGPRLAVRRGGIVLVLELGPVADDLPARDLLVEVATLATAELPVRPVATAGPSDDDTCTELAAAAPEIESLGPQTTVTDAVPNGCTLAIGTGGRVEVRPIETADPVAAVEGFGQSTNGTDWARTEVDVADGGAWIDDPLARGSGALLVASDEQLVRLDVAAPTRSPEESRVLATLVAEAAGL